MSASDPKAGLPPEAPPSLFSPTSKKQTMAWRAAPLLVALVGAFLSHILYSPLGFNPTDDGLQLAFARRLLDGEWPHRDFFSVRPALSYLLWAPLVAWTKDTAIFLSRAIVWLQWAAMAWLWASVLLRRVLRCSHSLPEELLCVATAFVLSSHTFPVMAWHTIDGLFLLTLGLALTKSPRRALHLLGWGLIGLAPLCKQSFAPAVPLLLLVSWHRSNPRAWLAATLPALAYFTLFAFAGCADRVVEQLTAHSRFLATAVLVYPIRYPLFVGVIAGAAAWIYLTRTRKLCAARILRSPLANVVPLVAAGVFAPLPWLMFRSPETVSIHLFAVVLGFVLGSVVLLIESTRSAQPLPHARQLRALTHFATEASIVAWCTAISVATNYPALAAGSLWCSVFAYLQPQRFAFRQSHRSAYAIALAATFAVLVILFHDARLHRIYREAPSEALTVSLTGIMKGASHLRTNPRTAAMLADLRDLTTSLSQQRRPYAILPDCAAWWIAAQQRNPLPLLWDNEVELPNATLRRQAIEALDSKRGTLALLITRYETDSLAEKLRPLAPRYPATQHGHSHWSKVGETSFFEIYE